MRWYLFILIGACTPLALASVLSFLDPAAGITTPGNQGGLDTARTAADEADARAANCRRLLDRFGPAGPVHPPPDDPQGQLAQSFPAVLKAERQWHDACSLVEECEKLPLGPVPWVQSGKIDAGQLAEVDQRLDRLQAFLKAREEKAPAQEGAEENRRDAIAGGSAVLDLVGERIAAIEREKKAVAALVEAGNRREEGKCADVLQALQGVTLADVENQQTRTELETILSADRAWAEYELARSGLPPDVEPQGPQQVREVIQALETFLAEHPDPPGPGEAVRHDRIRQRLAGLKARSVVQEEDQRLDAEIERLDTARDLDQLTDWLVALRRSMQSVVVRSKGQDPGFNEAQFTSGKLAAMRDALVRWLSARGFPRKEPPPGLRDLDPTAPRVLEATESNHVRRIGRFVPRPGGIFYEFYQWDKRFPTDAWDALIARNGFVREGEPKQPKYVRWAEEYNQKTAALIGRGASEEKWLAFLKRCEQIQQEFTAYRDGLKAQNVDLNGEPDRSCSEWTFLPDPRVLPHQSLDELSRRLAALEDLVEPGWASGGSVSSN